MVMLLTISQTNANSFHVVLPVLVGGGVSVVALFVLLHFLKHLPTDYFDHFVWQQGKG